MRGSGNSFFSRVAPTTQLLSTVPAEENIEVKNFEREMFASLFFGNLLTDSYNLCTVFTFKEQVCFGEVQLVTKGCCCVLHPRVGFKFNSYLQL